jgi:hypothetical protein
VVRGTPLVSEGGRGFSLYCPFNTFLFFQ